MLSWLVYFVNWLVYKPNFQILFREVLAKSRARPKMSLQKNLFTYFKRKYTTRRARHQFSHHFSQKTQRHHEPTHLHGLHSFRVDGRSIIIGDFCRSSPDKVSTIQWYDDDFANVCNVLRMLCLDLCSMSVASWWDKCKCFEVYIRPFRMPPVSNRCTLTPSIRQYFICSCRPDIDEAMPSSWC